VGNLFYADLKLSGVNGRRRKKEEVIAPGIFII
jgi:hypothetical protein